MDAPIDFLAFGSAILRQLARGTGFCVSRAADNALERSHLEFNVEEIDSYSIKWWIIRRFEGTGGIEKELIARKQTEIDWLPGIYYGCSLHKFDPPHFFLPGSFQKPDFRSSTAFVRICLLYREGIILLKFLR